MSDGHIELGFEERSLPRGAVSRRRLFEGGSGVIPSSLTHKSPLNLNEEALEVNEQAASLSTRAVLEAAHEDHTDAIQEENEEELQDEYHPENNSLTNAGGAGGAGPYHDDPDKSNQEQSFNDNYYWGSREGSPSGGVPAFVTFSNTTDPDVGVSGADAHADNVFQDAESSHKHRVTPMKVVSYVPAVLVGLLLNILDGLSYGMILFPLGVSVFAGLESAGLSLFYTSTIIAQLVFSLGGSGFKSCIGSEMIEIVPFFHAIAISIARKLEGSSQEEILATTITAFAVSCIVTGLTFFLLGWLRLGALVGFFPLHILLGCIGGVGWFLIATGVEVSARIQGGLQYNMDTLVYLFSNVRVVAQWGSCLALGGLLMWAERRIRSPIAVPTILVATFLLFHLVVALVPNLSLDELRDGGWLFPAQEAGEPWYWIYTFYRPAYIHIGPILESFPIILALNFFGIIHVPINIPALAAAIKEDDFNVNRELIAHGISNTLSGLFGSIQNYLVYTNSVLFIKSGADSPIAGIMLAGATCLVMLTGPVIIGYIPVIVVGSVIFMMGFDLIAEALIDTFGSVRKQEYTTMVVITLIMGLYDFVVGIIAGIILACLFFVINNARHSPVIARLSGEHVHSTVIRHPVLQNYLSKVGKQVFILRLTGPLFFGTNGTLEREVKSLCNCHANGGVATIKYLILDLRDVSDIDYCTVDTFMRLKRLLDSCRIRMVLAGAETAGHKIRGLKAVDLVPEVIDHNDPLSIRVFPTLNVALSWCENQFIKEYYHHTSLVRNRHSFQGNSHMVPTMPKSVPNISQWGLNELGMEGSPSIHNVGASALGTTPRSSFITKAARSAVTENLHTVNKWKRHQQPVSLLMQTVEPYSSKGVEFWSQLAEHLKRNVLSPGQVLPDGFHLVESGILHIQYESGYYETALAGTALGELAPNMKRSAEIKAESETQVWSLSKDKLKHIQSKVDIEVLTELLQVYLTIVSNRYVRMTEFYRVAALN